MKRTFNRLTWAVLLAMMLVSISASNVLVAAEPDKINPFDMGDAYLQENLLTLAENASDSETLTLWTPDGSQSMQVNPYGCKGKTHNPHASRHAGYRKVNVEARSTCDVNMTKIYVSTQLYKLYCDWLLICWYEIYGPLGKRTEYGKKKAETSSAGGPCITGFYKGASLHTAYDNSERVYFAFTSKTNYVTGCQN